ncbi:uncharacterized protein AB675_550 [Cyphellophora attinorum]|uniref:HD domain-containing protein n=1 Tax=Cyphellophora attinorum TaxID=1664694 RepID=A0A0N1HHK7_9EURO|nr:uncharacterized protein AB675_550 [Phialophora attinorum]KPI46034.1 hypothetical protein AB675_550 [Phialophora attinorum]
MSSPMEDNVPRSPLCQQAFALATETFASRGQALLNHSLRVFLFAKWLAEKESSPLVHDPHQLDLLFVTCICHDFGATNAYDGHERFEVCGADAAVRFLQSQQTSDVDCHKAWTGIALHTSPGIAERIDPFTRLVRLGVLIDFRQKTRDEFDANDYYEKVISEIPRLEIEKQLGDAVVAQALKQRDKAPPASWAGVLLRSHLEDPTWSGVNKAF